ncbi:MAG: hydrogen gas-evolving membrane-bound hydrogenase subunit E [Angelakisella sp.]
METKNKLLAALERYAEGEHFWLEPDHREAPPPVFLDQAFINYDEPTVAQRLHQLIDTHGDAAFAAFYKAVSVIVCLALSAVLLLTVSELPAFAAEHNPASNEVVRRYIEQGMAETGAVNLVTGMILDYRAFDTFGESAVLFIAFCSVTMLLAGSGTKSPGLTVAPHDKSIVLRATATLLIPIIILFGVYVILNGHLSPGGGFSGGAIIGSALILYSSAFGYNRIHAFLPFRTASAISCTALLVYAASKGYSFFTGANHLPSFITPGQIGHIFSAGFIPLLNICVGLTVTITMYGFFSLFKKGEL